jgi:DNA-binding PadR family transcriptional regulator
VHTRYAYCVSIGPTDGGRTHPGGCMSIRHGLLALLVDGPQHGYQLRQDFDSRTGATWPLNIGQVYTTLGRLTRDGLVETTGDGDDSHKLYALTTAGRATVEEWFATPVQLPDRPRDELAIKLALASDTPGIDLERVIHAQRTATVEAMQDYTRLKLGADPVNDVGWLLILDSLLFQAEAEVRWLDACEQRLGAARHRRSTTARRTPQALRAATKELHQ